MLCCCQHSCNYCHCWCALIAWTSHHCNRSSGLHYWHSLPVNQFQGHFHHHQSRHNSNELDFLKANHKLSHQKRSRNIDRNSVSIHYLWIYCHMALVHFRRDQRSSISQNRHLIVLYECQGSEGRCCPRRRNGVAFAPHPWEFELLSACTAQAAKMIDQRNQKTIVYFSALNSLGEIQGKIAHEGNHRFLCDKCARKRAMQKYGK